MKPVAGDTVLVHHRVTTLEGEVIESSFESDTPLRFTIDSNRVIPGLNDAVKRLEEGTSLSTTVPADQAHGVYDSAKYRRVRKTTFYQGIEIGRIITFQGDLGEPIRARVLREEGDMYVLDLNHALAGKDLVLDVRLVEILGQEEVAPFI